jgi:hypothetical protein
MEIMLIHPEKMEAMLIKRKSSDVPIPALLLNGKPVKWVRSSRNLGLTIDDSLKWTKHVDDLELGFSRKLNLLKSMRFLPHKMLRDFCWKVIFPAVTYGIVIWGSCNSTQMKTLERMHIRAARIIYGIAWDRPKKSSKLQNGKHSKQLTKVDCWSWNRKSAIAMVLNNCLI